MSSLVVFTVGHSTRAIEVFLDLLRGHGVQRLVDVRTVPRSRHNPQFAQEALAAALGAGSIAYEHAPVLGGLRRPRVDSPNAGWRNASFRGCADHMQTPAFHQAIQALVTRAARERTACMCAEGVPWRCHRSLIADALLVRRVTAEEIVSPTKTRVHRLTPFARVTGTTLWYPLPLDAAFDTDP
jgi:uncharacterized protein (DUF488 family)